MEEEKKETNWGLVINVALLVGAVALVFWFTFKSDNP
jgi:hypothetical protein